MRSSSAVDGRLDRRSVVSRGAILLFLVLAAHQAARPLHLDDMDFPAVAEATAQSGKPVYYRGEENRLHSGLYHPPLYIYLLAGWFRLFGSGPAQARMFGALCALLQGGLVVQILGRLFGRQRVREWRWLFWPVFLLNPYTLQVSAIPDIDSSVYGPLLLFVLWTAIRIAWLDGRWREDELQWWETALVALSLTIALWAKLTTVFLLFPFLFLFFLPRLGWQRAILVAAGISAAGLGLFFLSYYGYGALTGLDVGYTFEFLRASFIGPGRLLSYRSNFFHMVPFMVRWTGLLPWMSAAVLLAVAARRWWLSRDRRALYGFWLLSLGIASVVYYCGQVMTFAGAPFKYTFVFWGLLVSAPALLVAWLWETATAADPGAGLIGTEWRRQILWAGLGVGLAGWWIGAFGVGDVLLSGGWRFPQALVVWIPAGLAATGLTVYTGGRRGRGAVLGVGLTACSLLLHAGLQAGIATYQSRVDYSTTYNYGQTGLRDAAAFLWAHTTQQDVISSMKDVGFQAKRRYYENYGALYNDAATARLIAAWESGRVSYIVFTEGNGPDQLAFRPMLRDWIDQHAVLAASFGNYRIYRPEKAAGGV